ncbi:MAG: hypothetical protein IKE18_11295 [Oscillospiraceae bacterium]|nr:hypothetical protein [Oscillospiraceae bacterium]MBR2807346.1 hypothetical protein [Oscillospiraceae bacterium]
MKYKVKAKIPVEKKTLFGKKTVYEERWIWVDKKTYKEIQEKREDAEFEEALLLGDFDEDDENW